MTSVDRCKRLFCVFSALLVSTSCSDGKFTPYGGGERHAAGGAKAGGEFFKPGNSLDLYIIMDKSGSLFRDPSTPFTENTGSDPQCKRFDALLDMVDTLRTVAIQKEEVRLSVVTFGNKSRTLGTLDNILASTRAQIDERLREGICEFRGIESTYYAKGISASLSQHVANKATKKLDLESVLFFSDGAAKDAPEELREQIARLNSSFPNRVFGILLGNTSDKCSLSHDANKPLSTTDCLFEVVGKAEQRLIKAADAAGLSNAMKSLLSP